MNRKDIMRRVGSMQQLACVRPVTFEEGRSRGMKGIGVRNGCLELIALADKCLDLAEVRYKGVNLNFLSKPGLQGRNQYDTNGDEAIRSIMGGFLFTSGLESICAPCRIDGTDYPMHGRMRTTPGEHISQDACWEGDRYVMTVQAEMREAALFGENLVLRRRLRTVYGEKSFTLTDEIENESFRPEPMMLLYHINMGYPFLDEGTRICIPTKLVTPRDTDSTGHEDAWDRMDAPKDNEPEYVFIHDIQPDPDGIVRVRVCNDKLGLGLEIAYHNRNLPYFMEWKTTASGDYALGLEPANSSVYGRPWHEERGSVHHLEPFAKETNEFTFTILEGDELNR